MKNFNEMTLTEYVGAVKRKEIKSADAVAFFADRIKKDKHNAVLEVFADAAERAKAVDAKIAKGEKVGKLAGAPIIIKDNILYEGHTASAGSRILENFVAPYTATVVKKLLAEDAVILGRANMDEFAMGTTGETSAYGATLNAFDDGCVAGGSSSGSAVAVASGLCLAAIGSDTGGSIRVPASYNKLFGMKQTYGTVSRYGIVGYASGLEQAGAITKSALDLELVQRVITGADGYDKTLFEAPAANMFAAKPNFDIKKLRIGFLKETVRHKSSIQDYDKYEKLLAWFKSKGATVSEIEIDKLNFVLPAYYIIAEAEASSNLGRFDGVKYGKAAKNALNLEQLYLKTRTQFLGKEVKRRIMLGNFVLSSSSFDAYYLKAKKVQTAIRNGFIRAFEDVDCIIMPITLTDACKLGEKISNPVEMYLGDLFTIPANITGLPTVAIPFATGQKGLPVGFQVLGKHFGDAALLEIAKFFEKEYQGGAL